MFGIDKEEAMSAAPTVAELATRPVPVLQWSDIVEVETMSRAISQSKEFIAISASANIGNAPVALRVDDKSMMGPGRDSFEPGDEIILDPEASLTPGCFVVAVVSGIPMLRKYRPLTLSGDQYELVALHPDYPPVAVTAQSDVEIRGRVVRKIIPL